ncbi:MAG: DUF5131 family protein [Cytophagales bacterium]|nr:DUF5131 family protein [Cytophagales bacterium]
MGKDSHIQWTDATWNIAQGCTKVDEDCKFCYMYRNSYNRTRYNPFRVARTKTVFRLPLEITEPSLVFASSHTDVFHPDIDSYRNEFWDIIHKCPQHTFQVLTKRPERIVDHLPDFWQMINSNVWLGTSVGSPAGLHRLSHLVFPRKPMWLPRVLFLSIEPLYRKLEIPQKELSHLHWVIVGGESGNETGKYRYRECRLEWISSIVEQCRSMGVPVFVKQLGTHLSKKLGLRDRHGGNIEEWPEEIRVREMPHYYPELRASAGLKHPVER